MSYKVIAVLGDSISQGLFDESGFGWFGRLSNMISNKNEKYAFHNISMNGDKICDSYHRFASECTTRDIDTLIIAVGTNDLLRQGSPDAQLDISKELRGQYWDSLLDMAKTKIKQIVVLDVLPVREEIEDDGEVDIYQFNKDIEEYNKQIEKICSEKKIIFIKLYDKWAKRDLSDYYVDSGHPNGAGHQLIADEVFEELNKLGILN